MNPTPNAPKRFKPTPTYIIPAVLALAGFTIVGLVLVERGQSQVNTQTEAVIPATPAEASPPEAPSFLETMPGTASPAEPSPKAARTRHVATHRFTPAFALEEVKPEYPRIAKITRTQGPVEIQLRVDANGNPIQATVLRGNAMLQSEALKAAQSWKFAPARVNGRAVPSDFHIRFEFRLA